jgi:uncharacterized phage-associated protein
MQVMKLTYICHGFFLAKDLDVINETPLTWIHGPIYPSIALWLSRNKGEKVSKSPYPCEQATVDQIEKGLGKDIIDMVLNHYGSWTGKQLSKWTHRPNGPWERELFRSGRIDSLLNLNEMKNYFRSLLK